jgi:hypothetical protein
MSVQAYVEIMIFGGALLTRGDPTHFTWWGVGALCIANGSQLLPPSYDYDSARTRATMLAAITCTLIMVAVVAMSCTGCVMLNDALAEVGPWVYGGGNFALHYYPSLRGLALASKYTSHFAASDSAILLMAYCVLHQPDSVYGCGLPHAWLLAPVGLLVAMCGEHLTVAVCNSQGRDGCAK